MKAINVKSEKSRVKMVKKLMESCGNQIGSVWFYKRSDGELRKMSYRLHVRTPTYEKKPHGKNIFYRKNKNAEKNLMTVFDTNVMRYNNKNRVCGRGGYKSIPIDGVIRLKVGGTIYKVIS